MPLLPAKEWKSENSLLLSTPYNPLLLIQLPYKGSPMDCTPATAAAAAHPTFGTGPPPKPAPTLLFLHASDLRQPTYSVIGPPPSSLQLLCQLKLYHPSLFASIDTVKMLRQSITKLTRPANTRAFSVSTRVMAAGDTGAPPKGLGQALDPASSSGSVGPGLRVRVGQGRGSVAGDAELREKPRGLQGGPTVRPQTTRCETDDTFACMENDAFQKREKANEDYAIRLREKEKLLDLKKKLAEQQAHLKQLSDHIDEITKEQGGEHN
ncbi:mitochondrial atpase [Diaporthe eres]|nr:mitochondrial atpase [Diaporthe eres]